MKKMIEKILLIFDYDGTLVDSASIHQKAFEAILKPWKIQFDYNLIAGVKTFDAITFLLEKENIMLPLKDMDELVKNKQALARQMMETQLALFPKVLEFLTHAYDYHQLIVVSSGSRMSVLGGLKQLGIEKLFAHVICAEDVNYCKPNPEGFLLALEKTSVLAKDTLVFEDSIPGFIAANAAGVEFINVANFDWIYCR